MQSQAAPLAPVLAQRPVQVLPVRALAQLAELLALLLVLLPVPPAVVHPVGWAGLPEALLVQAHPVLIYFQLRPLLAQVLAQHSFRDI